MNKCPVIIEELAVSSELGWEDTIMLCTQRTGDPVCVFYFGPL